MKRLPNFFGKNFTNNMMEWLKKIFGGKKQEAAKEAPMSAPAAPEMPMGGSMPEEKKMGGEEMADEAGSEDMK